MNTCKNVVRSIAVAGLVMFGLGVVKKAEAAPGVNPDTMVVAVTPGGFTYAVVITSPILSGTTGYDFTQVNLGATTTSTRPIVVKSSGTVAEYFSLAISNSREDNWAPVAGTPGFNQFQMMAMFTGAGGQPLESSFTDALSNSVPGTASTLYGQGGATTPGNTQNLYLRLTMPSGVSNQRGQSMVLTVNGQSQ